MMKLVIVALALCVAINAAAPSTSGYYNIEKVFTFGFTYKYALNFQSTIQVPFNTGTVDLGVMNLCVQTFGSQAVGPAACYLNYMYDSSTDKLSYLTGDCDENVAKTLTDMRIKNMSYDSTKDSVTINFTSHAPTGGDFELTKGDSPVITCEAPKDKAPKEYCPSNTTQLLLRMLQ